jgi:alpha-L-arabinofuranosidase
MLRAVDSNHHMVRNRLLSIGLIAILLPVLAATAGCQTPAHKRDPRSPTNIAIQTRVLRSNVKRFGINLSGQSYYDSGQLMRDLAFRNPGFEGEMWQTVLNCRFVNGNSCADNDEWSGWPKDFAKGATFEFFYGAAKGQTGTVVSSEPAASSAHQGIWINFGHLAVPPAAGDFYIIRMKKPGDGITGWGPGTRGGANITTEFSDISPKSPGKQALLLNANGPGQSADVTANIDTWSDRSFVQLNGTFTLSFRAKSVSGIKQLTATVTRLSKTHGVMTYLTHMVPLTNSWQDFQFPFTGHEDGTYYGPIMVSFGVHDAAVLLDDASFTETPAHDNPTAYRNAVVERLRQLHPGILRYMDNGTSFGSTIDNLIAPPFARERAGFSEGDKEQQNIPIGLPEFLVLCQAVKAEPWFTMPSAMTQREARNLIEYLAGPATSPYGAKRAALGQTEPWTSVFPTIHLELGNETWNWGSFAGEAIPHALAYATRVSAIFGAAKESPLYNPAKFDLIMNGWVAVPWWDEQELSLPTHADTIDVAPYTFNPFDDASSTEAIFGPMLAEPESLDSRPTGFIPQQAKLAAKAGVKLAVYEVNLGTSQGKVSQQALEDAVPSLGAGLSVAEHMLLMLRDDGVTSQAMFALPEYVNGFSNPNNPNPAELVKLWGSVVDMGGQTNRVRPTFLAEQLANSAIADRMLETKVSGGDPTWDQPESPNSKVKIDGAHFIQSFAFTDGKRCSLVLFNLSRTSSLPVTFSGPVAPHGPVQVSRLTSAKITDSNEFAQNVTTTHDSLPSLDPAAQYALPPFSMTVLSWDVSGVHF